MRVPSWPIPLHPPLPSWSPSIRDKKISAVSAVRAALERAEQLKDLNAFIVLNRDGALAAAALVDAGKTTGALAGLPIVVKDNINTADLPTSAGTPALQNARPEPQRALAAEAARCRRHRHRQGQHA